jgi:thioredoxin
MLEAITDDTFATAAAGFLILLFTSPWCTGCKQVASHMNALSPGFEQIRFGMLDISSNPDTPAALGVLSIPTIIILKGGKEIGRLTGEIREKDLRRELERHS